MKKKINLFPLLGICAVVLTGAIFGMLAFTALKNGSGETFTGYDFAFGNNAVRATSNGGFVGAFVLAIIAGFFQILGVVFGFGQGPRKFAGFLHFVAGLALVAAAVLLFLGKVLVGEFIPGEKLTLGWGLLAAGGCAAASALLSLVNGASKLFSKAK